MSRLDSIYEASQFHSLQLKGGGGGGGGLRDEKHNIIHKAGTTLHMCALQKGIRCSLKHNL